MKYINKFLSAFIVYQVLTLQAFGAEEVNPKSELNLQEITLPSEVKDLSKSPGSIYYSTSVKNKVLIPVHMWGEIKQTGLHFVPSDTTLIKGLSLAGGPGTFADLEDIVLKRPASDGTIKEVEFDLSDGGDLKAHQFKLEAGDTVFVKKNTFYENRSYYTSLIGIVLTVVSTFFIIEKVR